MTCIPMSVCKFLTTTVSWNMLVICLYLTYNLYVIKFGSDHVTVEQCWFSMF